jgi:hypothetical protein
MPNNKYELRSSEVQEVIKSTPKKIITWGNTIVLIFVIAGILFLNSIAFPKRITIPFELYLEKKQCFVKVDSEFFDQIKVGSNIWLTFESYPVNRFGIIELSIDSLFRTDTICFLKINSLKIKMATNTGKTINLKSSMLGHAEVVIGRENVLQMLKEKIN